jgi:hypothetical protein
MSTKKKPAAKSGGTQHNRPGELAGQTTSGAGAAVALEPYMLDANELATIQELRGQIMGAQTALNTFLNHVIRSRNLPTERGNWSPSEDYRSLIPPTGAGRR